MVVYIHYFNLVFHTKMLKQPDLGRIWFDKHIWCYLSLCLTFGEENLEIDV